MQTIPNLPPSAVFIPNKNDKGKKVKINSIGGALRGCTGTIIQGPYTFDLEWEVKDKIKGKTKTITTTSDLYWQVLVDKYNLYLNFVEQELK